MVIFYGEYSIKYIAKEFAQLPVYKGTTLYGSVKSGLKQTICALKFQRCETCILLESCLFPSVFFPGQSIENKETIKPEPIVISPPPDYKTCYKKGAWLKFKIILLGEINNKKSYFIYALTKASQAGIGKRIHGKRGRFVLQEIKQGKKIIYNDIEKIIYTHALNSIKFSENSDEKRKYVNICVRFETPLLLISKNKRDNFLSFISLSKAIIERTCTIFENYGKTPLNIDIDKLLLKAKTVKFSTLDIYWYDLRKYSFQKKKNINMGGIKGNIVYKDVPVEFLPFFEFCEKVNIGIQTSMGFGKIKTTIL